MANDKAISPYDLMQKMERQTAEEIDRITRDINMFLEENIAELARLGELCYDEERFAAFSDPVVVEVRRRFTNEGWIVNWSDGFFAFKLPGKLIVPPQTEVTIGD